ncbi:MAG TPA: hypothetical protein VJG90_05705 [Candidatus Nanoarchaeia archaeon]|nr:hypothetical protein [Candidatus Nanoarchaeia archaeon]
MQTKSLLQLNAVLFGIIALLHVLRFLSSSPARIANWNIPLWLSIVAFIVSAWLCWQNWKAT